MVVAVDAGGESRLAGRFITTPSPRKGSTPVGRDGRSSGEGRTTDALGER